MRTTATATATAAVKYFKYASRRTTSMLEQFNDRNKQANNRTNFALFYSRALSRISSTILFLFFGYERPTQTLFQCIQPIRYVLKNKSPRQPTDVETFVARSMLFYTITMYVVVCSPPRMQTQWRTHASSFHAHLGAILENERRKDQWI